MGNLTIEELTGQVGSTGVFNPNQTSESENTERERRDNVAVASYGDKQSAFFEQAKKINTVSQIFDYGQDVIFSNIEADETFAWDDTTTIDTLKKYELPITDFAYLRKSKSRTEMDYRVNELIKNRMIDDEINKNLSNSQRVAASVAGSVVDLDVAVGFGAGALYSTGTSIMKIATIEGGIEAGLAAVKYGVNDNYTVEDAVIDTILGTGIAVGATQLFRSWDNTRGAKAYLSDNNAKTSSDIMDKKYNWSSENPVDLGKQFDIDNLDRIKKAGLEKANAAGLRERIYKQMNLNEDEISKIIEKDLGEPTAFATWHRDIQNQQREISDRLKVLEKPFNPDDPVPNKPHLHSDEIAELRSEQAGLRERLRSREARRREELDVTLRSEKEKVGIEIEEAEFRTLRNSELVEQFKDKRYESYNINKRTFFKDQENLNAKVLKTELDKVNKNIDNIKVKLKKAQASLKTAKSEAWKTRHRKSITTLQKDLEEAKKGLRVGLDDAPLSKKQQDLQNLADEMSLDIHNIKDELTLHVKQAAKEDLPALLDLAERLKAKAPIEMENIYSLVKSKMNNKTAEAVGVKSRILPKAVALTVGLAVAGNAAGDEDGNIAAELTGVFLLAVMTGVFGKDIVRGIRNANLRDIITQMSDKFKNSYESAKAATSPEAGVIRRTSNWIARDAHTRLTSTIAPFDKAGGKAKEIAQKLLFGKDSGDGAEVTKAMWNSTGIATYNVAEKRAFKSWKVEKGVAGMQGVFSDINNIHQFRQVVADQMILRNTDSPAIRKMIEVNDDVLAEAYTRAKDTGVFGFDKITYKKGLLPRYWENQTMHNIVSRLSDTDKQKVIDSLGKAIAKKSGDMTAAKLTAEEFVTRWSKGFEKHREVNHEDLFALLSGQLKDDVTFEELAGALNTTSNKSSRAKYRIDFDPMDIEDVKVNVDGNDVIVGRTNMINNDIKAIVDKTLNQLNGSSALAKNGYKSVAELDKAIDSVTGKGSETLRKELNMIRDLVLGIPVEHNSPLVHNTSMAIKDLTIAAKLPFVVFSLGTELINTLGASKLNKTVAALSESTLVAFGKDSYMMGELSRISGLATNVNRVDFSGFRGVSENADNIDDLSNTSKIRNGTMRIRDYSLYLNRLMGATDLFQRAGTAINTEKLARFINLSDTDSISGVSKTRLNMYGVTDERVNLLKDKFEFNDKGKLKEIDFSTWKANEEDALGEILRAMNQSVSPESTIGETALFAHTTDIGRAFSTLSMYPMQQYNIQGLGGLQAFDKTSFVHAFSGFAGSYIGLHARYAVQGKDVDNEKLIMYSLMNIPQLGALSYMTSMLSPATLQVVNEAAGLVGMEKR